MDIEQALAELGLEHGASVREVQLAWRRMVRKWHPDRNASAEAVVRMQRINHAFAVLKSAGWDDDKTGEPPADPDSTAQDAADDSAGSAANGAANRAANGGKAGAEADTTGAATPPRRVRRKQALTLEEAAVGCIKVLRGKLSEPCAQCDGVGYHVTEESCTHCDGRGKISARLWFSWVASESECEHCGGSGLAREPCESCEGSGAHTHPYRVSVRIPPGARAGDVLRVTSPRGSSLPIAFELTIALRPHELFHLDDAGTLCCGIPVNGFAWIGNSEVEVPTLSGLASLRLERGKYLYHLPGQGYPVRQGGERGDLVVTVQPRFPASLDDEQCALLAQLAEASEADDATLAAWRQTLAEWARKHDGSGARAQRRRKTTRRGSKKAAAQHGE